MRSGVHSFHQTPQHALPNSALNSTLSLRKSCTLNSEFSQNGVHSDTPGSFHARATTSNFVVLLLIALIVATVSEKSLPLRRVWEI
ncbi:hypothetical protein M758_5G191600 [Ceratodon purpureus]|nr:hypothetical protein M758_5G191600 [Ceratodon purpureus]